MPTMSVAGTASSVRYSANIARSEIVDGLGVERARFVLAEPHPGRHRPRRHHHRMIKRMADQDLEALAVVGADAQIRLKPAPAADALKCQFPVKLCFRPAAQPLYRRSEALQIVPQPALKRAAGMVMNVDVFEKRASEQRIAGIGGHEQKAVLLVGEIGAAAHGLERLRWQEGRAAQLLIERSSQLRGEAFLRLDGRARIDAEAKFPLAMAADRLDQAFVILAKGGVYAADEQIARGRTLRVGDVIVEIRLAVENEDGPALSVFRSAPFGDQGTQRRHRYHRTACLNCRSSEGAFSGSGMPSSLRADTIGPSALGRAHPPGCFPRRYRSRPTR